MYRGDTLFKVRYGHYKAHLYTWGTPPDAQYLVSWLNLFCVTLLLHSKTSNLLRGFVMFQGYHYCPGERVANLTQDEMLDFTHEPLLFHLGRDPGEKYTME